MILVFLYQYVSHNALDCILHILFRHLSLVDIRSSAIILAPARLFGYVIDPLRIQGNSDETAPTPNISRSGVHSVMYVHLIGRLIAKDFGSIPYFLKDQGLPTRSESNFVTQNVEVSHLGSNPEPASFTNRWIYTHFISSIFLFSFDE